jgi:hypothetical protein
MYQIPKFTFHGYTMDVHVLVGMIITYCSYKNYRCCNNIIYILAVLLYFDYSLVFIA